MDVLGSAPMWKFIQKISINYNRAKNTVLDINLRDLVTKVNKDIATRDAIDLLIKVIAIDPAKRISGNSALQH